MKRRQMLQLAAFISLPWAVNINAETAADTSGKLHDKPTDKQGDYWSTLTEAQWKEKLTKEQFAVLRKEATERAGTSPLNDEKRVGVYHCAGCDLPLFESDKKYESGTGWPSFFDVIPDAIGTKTDYKAFWPRVEYHCSRCKGHQGHVFKDGPQPTGLRYCNNGIALVFKPN